MSAAVDDALYHYERQIDEDEAREIAIERLTAEYLTDAAKLGDAVSWLDHDTKPHKHARKLIGALMLTAMQFAAGKASVASLVNGVTAIGQQLRDDQALQGAVEKLAERAIEYAESHPDYAGD